jgi:hypothetical protein
MPNSRYLFTHVTPGTLSDYRFDCRAFSEDELLRLCTHFDRRDASDGPLLGILPHVSQPVDTRFSIQLWCRFFQQIFHSNPGLQTVSLHFFEEWHGAPFFLEASRGGEVFLCIGGTQDATYMRASVRWFWARRNRDPPKFSVESYRTAYFSRRLRTVRTSLDREDWHFLQIGINPFEADW